MLPSKIKTFPNWSNTNSTIQPAQQMKQKTLVHNFPQEHKRVPINQKLKQSIWNQNHKSTTENQKTNEKQSILWGPRSSIQKGGVVEDAILTLFLSSLCVLLCPMMIAPRVQGLMGYPNPTTTPSSSKQKGKMAKILVIQSRSDKHGENMHVGA